MPSEAATTHLHCPRQNYHRDYDRIHERPSENTYHVKSMERERRPTTGQCTPQRGMFATTHWSVRFTLSLRRVKAFDLSIALLKLYI